jgi:hypothetical protein
MLVLCIGLALLFVASFFFTLIKGAKLDHERELKRTKGNRILVLPSSTAVGNNERDSWSTYPVVLEQGLHEQASVAPVQARGQRVQKIRVACDPSPSIRLDARSRHKLGLVDFTGSSIGEQGVGSSQDEDYTNAWATNGIEGQVNPLFVTTETGSFCPPRSGGHKVSDW